MIALILSLLTLASLGSSPGEPNQSTVYGPDRLVVYSSPSGPNTVVYRAALDGTLRKAIFSVEEHPFSINSRPKVASNGNMAWIAKGLHTWDGTKKRLIASYPCRMYNSFQPDTPSSEDLVDVIISPDGRRVCWETSQIVGPISKGSRIHGVKATFRIYIASVDGTDKRRVYKQDRRLFSEYEKKFYQFVQWSQKNPGRIYLRDYYDHDMGWDVGDLLALDIETGALESLEDLPRKFVLALDAPEDYLLYWTPELNACCMYANWQSDQVVWHKMDCGSAVVLFDEWKTFGNSVLIDFPVKIVDSIFINHSPGEALFSPCGDRVVINISHLIEWEYIGSRQKPSVEKTNPGHEENWESLLVVDLDGTKELDLKNRSALAWLDSSTLLLQGTEVTVRNPVPPCAGLFIYDLRTRSEKRIAAGEVLGLGVFNGTSNFQSQCP